MRARILFLVLTPPLGAVALFGIAGLRINSSASLPAGLYIASSAGAFVEFCPDDHGLSAERGYRHTPFLTPWAKGVCPDGAPRLRRTATGKADSGTACDGFAWSSGEIQRLPSASSGRSLCVVSNVAPGARRCRQTSRMHRQQTYLASPPAANLGHGTAQLWTWAASPHEVDGAQKYSNAPSVFEGRPARSTARVLPGTAELTPVLLPPLALRLYGYSGSAWHPPSGRRAAPSIGDVSTAILR